MKMQNIMHKIILQLIIGLLCAIIGALLVGVIFYGLDRMHFINELWGDKVVVISGLLIGLPLGCVAGLVVVDKFLKVSSLNLTNIFLSLTFGVIASIISILFIVNAVGNAAAIIMPLIILIFSIFGYHAKSLLNGN